MIFVQTIQKQSFAVYIYIYIYLKIQNKIKLPQTQRPYQYLGRTGVECITSFKGSTFFLMDPDASVSKYYGMTLVLPKRPQNKRE